MKVLLCDIDGTLADCRHRLHHVLPGSKRDHAAFFAALDQDEVINPVRLIIYSVAKDHRVILVSGRPENYRPQTEAWLARHGIDYYHRLYMRPAGDTRPDHVVKRELLDQILADGYEPFASIDDRDSTTAVWRDNGIMCLQVRAAEPDIPTTARLMLMVGPSGGGKTRWLRNSGIPAEHVISSDQVRQDLCGDFRDQSRNQEVFAAVHSVARARLRAGLPVVIDATHLRRKDRMTAAALVPATNPVTYVIVDRPMAYKRRDGGWRNELPIDLLARHELTFRSQISEILKGDGLPNVSVVDTRT